MLPPMLMTWERVLIALAVSVREPSARTVWEGGLAEGDVEVGGDWRGEYVIGALDWDGEASGELVDSVFGSSGSLVGWSVK